MMMKTTTKNDKEDKKSDQELKQHFDQGESRRMVVAILGTPTRISTATTILIDQFANEMLLVRTPALPGKYLYFNPSVLDQRSLPPICLARL